MSFHRIFIAVFVCTFALAETHAAEQPGRPFPAGDLMQDRIAFQYAVYCLPTCKGDLMKALQAEVHEIDPKLIVLVGLPKKNPDAPAVWVHVENDVAGSYAPPDLKGLQYFGKGITHDQAVEVQGSRQAIALIFAHPKTFAWSGLKTANVLVERVARRVGGLIWDDDSRLMYSADAWHSKRVESWTSVPAEVANHIAIHSYDIDGAYVRSITLGMAKFGLPDIVVEQFSWSDDRNMGNLINSLAQVMAEGARFRVPGTFDLDLRTIRNDIAREKQTKTLLAGATSVAHLNLSGGVPDEGDPKNRLIEIGFDQYSGNGVRAKQDAMLSSLFGAQESVARVKHDGELLKASNKARSRLPELKKAFNDGLQPGAFIELKVPFDVPNDSGHEYMWVEVTKWDDAGKIQGLLRNDPELIPNLHAGEIVAVEQSKVFDYILRHADGSQEGNETGQIILRMQQEHKD